MLYLSGVQGPSVREAVADGRLGIMNTPANSYVVDGFYACDNGRFGKGWPGHEKWWAWLQKTIERDGAGRCLFAVAPDIPFDAAGTLAESLPWLPRIRALGVPAAFVAQDGCEGEGMVPWDDFDVLFLGGSTDWKLGRAAADVAHDAKTRGKKVHMGRVNSETRLRHAMAIGCDTSDGTFIGFGPEKNLRRVHGWFDRLPRRQPPHVEFPMFDFEVS